MNSKTFYRRLNIAGRLTYKYVPVTLPEGAELSLMTDNYLNLGICRWRVDFKNSKGKWTGFTAYTSEDESFFKN